MKRIWDIVIRIGISDLPSSDHQATVTFYFFSFAFDTTMSNLVDITSDTQFSSLISKKDAVIVLDFWAPWAEPCKQMNDVIAELAGKFSSLQFLKVT